MTIRLLGECHVLIIGHRGVEEERVEVKSNCRQGAQRRSDWIMGGCEGAGRTERGLIQFHFITSLASTRWGGACGSRIETR